MALTPIVVTSGGTCSSVTINPVIAPISAPVASAAKIQKMTTPVSVLLSGSLVTTTAQNDMTPAVERSSPRCWMTRCWPIDATARMAKYGSVERIAAVEIVLGAAIPPISTRIAVAMNALAASGNSVRSMPSAGNRRRLVRSSAIS